MPPGVLSSEFPAGRSSSEAWSLWLEPDEKAKSAFSQIIASLASTSPSSPIFGPHATLHGHVDISLDVITIRQSLERIIAERQTTGPLHLSCLPATTGSTFFQSVLAPVEPTDDLLALKKACDGVWGETAPFFPHISLKYGDIDEDRRQEIAELARGEQLPTTVEVRGITIVRCVGTAAEWEMVDFVPFK